MAVLKIAVPVVILAKAEFTLHVDFNQSAMTPSVFSMTEDESVLNSNEAGRPRGCDQTRSRP
jgi:hypothetical protein